MRVTRFEENVLAVLLALITTVSFTQVVARYSFNSGWTGAPEFTRILFAWMILFGMSYGLKQGMTWASMRCYGCFPNPCSGSSRSLAPSAPFSMRRS